MTGLDNVTRLGGRFGRGYGILHGEEGGCVPVFGGGGGDFVVGVIVGEVEDFLEF